jgi:LPS-assembly protein
VFQVKQNNARGSASMMRGSDKLHYQYENATYTTCPPGNDDWLVRMSSLEIDREAQVGTAYNSRIEFMGVPFLYTPWMDFPLQGRKSGFLAPTWGYTASGGQEYSFPFYWNIAPNYDATISPRVMDKRGTQLNDEFRYMGESYTGEAHYDVLQNDRISNSTRTHTSLKHAQNLGGGLTATMSLNRVGDDAYFRDLSPTAIGAIQTQLLNEGSLNYSAGWWSASMRLQSYQTLQDQLAPVAVPYQRMPQINLNAQKTLNDDFEDMASVKAVDPTGKEVIPRKVEVLHPTVVNFSSEYVDFLHPTQASGQRLVLYPSATYSLLSDPGYYLRPKLGIHNTQYVMGVNNSSNIPDASRTLPIFSLDGGMTFERDMTLGQGEYVQTLEPRAFYVKIPYQNQDMLPLYDTSQAAFSFAQMFSENRFFGNDRIGDANMMTMALTSRLIDNDGGVERLRVAVGERFSYEAPRVNLVAPSANSQSDILLSVGGRVTNALTLDSLYQYDPNTRYVLSYNATARYKPETGKVLNLGYRYSFVDGTTQNDLRQGDVSVQWPLFRHWDAVSRWTYSWTEQRILEQMVGLEYNQSCWALRLVAQKFPIPGQHVSTSIFLQLELNDLVAVGSDPLSMLRMEVPGYSKLNTH